MLNNAPNNPKKNNGKQKYKQGNFIPENKDKVIKLNGQRGVYYRSGYELKCFTYFDKNPNIIKWGGEIVTIPYTKVSPKKQEWGETIMKESSHRYFPDCYYEILNKDGTITKVIAEIKPYSETFPPKLPKSANKKQLENFEYAMNMYNANLFKWEAAISYCKSRDLKFVIITEQYFKHFRNG